MDRLLQDLRFAVRTLARTPVWTAAAVVTLALGTGANAAVFSFVDALVLRPAPGVGEGASLVAVFTSDFSSGLHGDSSYPDFVSIAAGTTAFDGLAASDDSVVAPLRVGDDVSRVRAARVSGSYFDVLKMRPVIGRFLNDSDCAPGSAPIAVVSDALWRRLFAGDPAGLGTVIRLNG